LPRHAWVGVYIRKSLTKGALRAGYAGRPQERPDAGAGAAEGHAAAVAAAAAAAALVAAAAAAALVAEKAMHSLSVYIFTREQRKRNLLGARQPGRTV
jgi:hypothetical protein